MKNIVKMIAAYACMTVLTPAPVAANSVKDLVGKLTCAATETATGLGTSLAAAAYSGSTPVINTGSLVETLARHMTPTSVLKKVADLSASMSAYGADSQGATLAAQALVLTTCLNQAWSNQQAALQVKATQAYNEPSLRTGLHALNAAIDMVGVVCLTQLAYAGVVPAALTAAFGQ